MEAIVATLLQTVHRAWLFTTKPFFSSAMDGTLQNPADGGAPRGGGRGGLPSQEITPSTSASAGGALQEAGEVV